MFLVLFFFSTPAPKDGVLYYETKNPGLFFPATGDRVYCLVEKLEILESIILREVVYNKLVG